MTKMHLFATTESNCRYPVHVWRDADSQKLRMDTYNHTNSLITTKVLGQSALAELYGQQCNVMLRLSCCVQDDAVVISPRIDSLDCDDVGPYLPHGLGSVNSMMLDASVRLLQRFVASAAAWSVSAAFLAAVTHISMLHALLHAYLCPCLLYMLCTWLA